MKPLEALTGDEAERFEALADAFAAGHLALTVTEAGELVLEVTPAGAFAVTAAYGGSKSEALAAAKELAALHGRPKPRSVATAASDPVLVALLTADA